MTSTGFSQDVPRLTPRVAWLASFVVTSLVLVALLFIQSRRGGLVANFTGGTTYRQIAGHLAESGRFTGDGTHPTGYRPPVYPIVLSGLIRIAGAKSQAMALLLNVTLDLACLGLLLALVGRLTCSARAVLAAGVLFALNTAYHHEALAQRETMLYTLMLLAFCLICARRHVELAGVMGAAVLTGLAWLTRPSGIVLIPVLGYVALFGGPDRSWKLRLGRLCTAACLLGAIVLPWQAFLYRSFHAPVLSGTTSGGLNLYQGNNPAADVLMPFVDIDVYKPVIDARLAAAGIPEYEELEYDRQLRAEALANIRNAPLTFARRTIVKVLALFSPVPTPLGSAKVDVDQDGRVMLQNYRYNASPWTVLMTLHGCALLIGLGIAVVKRDRIRRIAPLGARVIVAYVLLTALLHATTFGETRFRLPLDPLLIALVAAALFPRIAPARSAAEPSPS